MCVCMFIPLTSDMHRKCLEGNTHSRLLTVTTSEERFFFFFFKQKTREMEFWFYIILC